MNTITLSPAEIQPDGAECDRFQKAELVSGWQKGLEKLRVCWQGEDLSKNCGKCAKCKRTIINFKTVGIESLPCMPEISDDELLDFQLTQVEHKEMLPVFKYLEKHPIHPTPSWVEKLREKLSADIQEGKPRKRSIFSKLFKKRKRDASVTIMRPEE